MRLFPDGTAVRFALPAGQGYNGTRQVSATDVVQFPAQTGRRRERRARLPTPASPSRAVEPVALAYEATGNAADICRAASIAVSLTGYDFDPYVVADTTSVADGTEWRWLVCAGDPASGWNLTALLSDDSATWRVTSLGYGYFNHAGDRAVVAVGGAQATVWWQSLVGEQLVEATTGDLGVTWAVSDVRSS